MKKAKPKECKIDTFDKLINVVNNENVERLSVDLYIWLAKCNSVLTKYRKLYPDETKDKKNSQILKCSFVWIDDGKHDDLGFTLENLDTGEITHTK